MRRVICPICDGSPVADDGSICSTCGGECMVEAMKAPWKDFSGSDIHEGDVISHPCGERGKVVFLPEYSEAADQWRVDYDGIPLSRLCLQIGDKGQAVVVERATDSGSEEP